MQEHNAINSELAKEIIINVLASKLLDFFENFET